MKLPLHMALDENADYGTTYNLPNDYYMEVRHDEDEFGKAKHFLIITVVILRTIFSL
jgi:hypothetical protein